MAEPARKTLLDIETPLLDVALRRSHGSSNVQNSTITQWIVTPSAETRRGCILVTPKQNAAGSALFELLPGDGAFSQFLLLDQCRRTFLCSDASRYVVTRLASSHANASRCSPLCLSGEKPCIFCITTSSASIRL